MSKKLSNDKGITKFVTGSMTREISAKRVVIDNSPKHQEDLDKSANHVVEVPKKIWMA